MPTTHPRAPLLKALRSCKAESRVVPAGRASKAQRAPSARTLQLAGALADRITEALAACIAETVALRSGILHRQIAAWLPKKSHQAALVRIARDCAGVRSLTDLAKDVADLRGKDGKVPGYNVSLVIIIARGVLGLLPGKPAKPLKTFLRHRRVLQEDAGISRPGRGRF